nr:S1/P1 nuclease [Haliscomenobacter sp.]
MGNLDPDFWALESNKLAAKYVYGVKGKDDQGRNQYLRPNDEPTPFYLEQAQEVVRKQLALSGYRLAAMLNEVFSEKK